MRTPDEIKKGMACCLTRWEGDYLASCHTDCPYRSEGIWCRNVLMADIKAWNKQLESRLAQVERERDALLHDLRRADYVDCYACKHKNSAYDCDVDCTNCLNPCTCNSCHHNNKWEWRGLCEENTHDQPSM